jgi:DNA-binding CsgD family transcriptional regulator
MPPNPANDGVSEIAEDSDDSPLRLQMALLLAVICIAGVTDIVLDRPSNWLSPHVLIEGTMVIVAATGAALLWREWQRARASVQRLRSVVDTHRAEREAWRESARAALDGLGRAIDARFDGWSLTPAERDVALLLLKGESHKRIATLTDRSERTVRQHAVTVYQKSGLRGRAELAAFFLTDLMLPGGREPTP